MAPVEGGLVDLVREGEARVVGVDVLLTAGGVESFHHLEDALDFLVLAVSYTFSVQIEARHDIVSAPDEHRSLNFEKLRNDPRLGLKLLDSPRPKHLKSVSGCLLVKIVVIVFEHDFK